MSRILALTSLCLALSLSACGSVKVVEKPVPVEVVRTEYVPVPFQLVRPRQLQTVPDTMTYGDAMILWARDREALRNANAQLIAIGKLGNDQR